MNYQTRIEWLNDEIDLLTRRIKKLRVEKSKLIKLSKPKEINLSQAAIDLVPPEGEILISTLCRKSNSWRLLCQKDLFIQYDVLDRNGLSTKDAPKGGRYVFRTKDEK